eukprot:5580051-Amphidinium_carterae.1
MVKGLLRTNTDWVVKPCVLLGDILRANASKGMPCRRDTPVAIVEPNLSTSPEDLHMQPDQE